MKKFLALALAVVMVFAMTACGGSESGSGDAPAAAEQAASGETVDTGLFQVLVPGGWMKYPQTDMFGEKDSDGNYPLKSDSYGMIKGGTSEFDAFSKPAVYVSIFQNDAASQGEMTVMWYDESKEISVSVNGTECTAYEAQQENILDEGKFYVYQLVFIPLGDSVCAQVTVPVDMIDFKGMTVEDPDIVAIMESITLD